MHTDRQTDSSCIVQSCDAYCFLELVVENQKATPPLGQHSWSLIYFTTLVTHSTYALYAPLRNEGLSGRPAPRHYDIFSAGDCSIE